MFRFESMNGKVYDVLSYDNERALTLLYEVNDSMENTYLVVENMKNNGLIWAKEHSFTNYKEAHNYFVIEVYNALDYKEQFRNVLKQEEINLEGVSFDMLYAYFMEDDSTSGFIDRQYIEDLISDVKENEKEGKEVNNFLDDEEKMRDFHVLSKEEFLLSYSYLTEEEYHATLRAVNLEINNDTLTFDDVIKTIHSYNKETNLLEVKQEIEKVLDNNPHVNYTITLTNIDNLKESYQCYGYHSFDMAIQEANKKLDEHSSNYPFRAVLNVTTYEQLHPTFGTPIDEKVVYTKDISSLLFENSSIDLTQMKQDTFLIEDIKKEQKKGLSHIKDLGTTSQISSDNEVKKHEQER